MKLPVISVFATSIRPHHWLAFHASIAQATTESFEIVFTGPVPPPFTLPDNFRHISTVVKPAQAMEAAFRFTKGAFVVQAVDDVAFSAGALDRMLAVAQSDRTALPTCTYWVHGGNHMIAHTEGIFGDCGVYPKADQKPTVPICPLLHRWQWLGIDPVFCAQYGEMDIFLRLLLNPDYKTVFVDGTVTEASGGSDLWRTKGQGDLTVLRKLWRLSGTGNWTSLMRGPIGAYDSDTILTDNQGTVF